MKKNKKPMTEAQREAKRIRDAKYRAAKKAAKVAKVEEQKTVAKPAAAKKTVAKKVAKPVKTALPKPTVAVVEPRRVHVIKPGDAIHFDGFTADKIVALATGIICETAVKDHQHCLAEAFKELTRNSAKSHKKESKK